MEGGGMGVEEREEKELRWTYDRGVAEMLC
jgi:hypothetical protein